MARLTETLELNSIVPHSDLDALNRLYRDQGKTRQFHYRTPFVRSAQENELREFGVKLNPSQLRRYRKHVSQLKTNEPQ